MTEDDIAELARKWVTIHVPIFSVAESYGVSAFIAGYQAAQQAQEEATA